MVQTKFLLDSGDPQEFLEIAKLAKDAPHGTSLWGATTNPSLIAKNLSGKKVTQQEAFELQKQLVIEIIGIVPGAVSAEVYADDKTTADEMIAQGRQITTWHERVVVKLPTTIEGFKARTLLRKEKVPINNTLVFSQTQIFAICLHENVIQKLFGPISNLYSPFISPFVGRLDDQGEDGMAVVEQGMKIKRLFDAAPPGAPWMLEASVRRPEHIKRGIDAGVEILTAPAKVYHEWFALSEAEQNAIDPTSYAQSLTKIPYWNPPEELRSINTVEGFMDAIESRKLNIHHDLTDKGLVRFAQDWKSIIAT